MRYILEGTWTGYTSAQQRVVHREVVSDKKRIERLRKLHTIVYTDGTSLLLHLREAKPREHVEERHQYDDLIREAEREDKSHVLVAELPSTKRVSADTLLSVPPPAVPEGWQLEAAAKAAFEGEPAYTTTDESSPRWTWDTIDETSRNAWRKLARNVLASIR